jgi:uncharacterized protein YqgC (DUF456 family)
MEMIDWSTIIGWIVVVALFAIGMIGAVFPILPGVVAIMTGFIVYGLFFGYDPFGTTYWVIQISLFIIIFASEYAITSLAVKRSGGSKGSVTGTNIGLILGPLLIPSFGVLLGPFIGSLVGEMPTSRELRHLLKVGFGSLVGFVISTMIKIVLQLVMIGVFVWVVANAS